MLNLAYFKQRKLNRTNSIYDFKKVRKYNGLDPKLLEIKRQILEGADPVKLNSAAFCLDLEHHKMAVRKYLENHTATRRDVLSLYTETVIRDWDNKLNWSYRWVVNFPDNKIKFTFHLSPDFNDCYLVKEENGIVDKIYPSKRDSKINYRWNLSIPKALGKVWGRHDISVEYAMLFADNVFWNNLFIGSYVGKNANMRDLTGTVGTPNLDPSNIEWCAGHKNTHHAWMVRKLEELLQTNGYSFNISAYDEFLDSLIADSERSGGVSAIKKYLSWTNYKVCSVFSS